jgi:hypothetical protein
MSNTNIIPTTVPGVKTAGKSRMRSMSMSGGPASSFATGNLYAALQGIAEGQEEGSGSSPTSSGGSASMNRTPMDRFPITTSTLTTKRYPFRPLPRRATTARADGLGSPSAHPVVLRRLESTSVGAAGSPRWESACIRLCSPPSRHPACLSSRLSDPSPIA